LKIGIIIFIIISFITGACDDKFVNKKSVSKIIVVGNNVSKCRSLNTQGSLVTDTIWYLNALDELFFTKLDTDTNRLISVNLNDPKYKERFYQYTKEGIESGLVNCEEDILRISETFTSIDTLNIVAARPMITYGAPLADLNDSLTLIPILYLPEGKQFSSKWLQNAGRYGRVAIVDKINCLLQVPFEFEDPLIFNAFLEHPIIGYSSVNVYYCQAYMNEIYEWDIETREVRKIKTSEKNISTENYNYRKIAKQKAGLSYYQKSQFVTGLWVDTDENVLIRRIKKSQKEVDEEGLNIPPYWANMIFEVIDLDTGIILNEFEINGEIYDNRSCFIRNGLVYVENEKESNSDTISFDSFLYFDRL